MNKAIFFNPTKLSHLSIMACLNVFDSFQEKRTAPIGLKYLKQGLNYSQQASAAKKPDFKIVSKLRALLHAMQYSGFRSYFEKFPGTVAVVWNGRSGVRFIFIQAAKDSGVKTLYLELSPLPNTITVDPVGINYLNVVPRSTQFYLNYARFDTKWRFILRFFAQRAQSAKTFSTDNITNSPYIFVALQSEGDSQLRDFGGNYRTVDAFFNAICSASEEINNDRKILIKEHPNCSIGAAEKAKNFKNIHIVNDLDTMELCKNADLVVTVNSSVGLQALFMEKPVAVAGDAFWGLEDLCYSAKDLDALKQLFSIVDYSSDDNLRNSFLNYLVDEYYIHLSWQADSLPSLPPSEKQKVLSRVN